MNGKIYVIGGTADGKVMFPTVEEYNPKTDTWTQKANMPTPRSGLSTAVVDGKIYAIGGAQWNGVRWVAIPTVEVYDPATDTWIKKADMPTPRDNLSTAVVNGKIYAIGGVIGWDPISLMEVYNSATDSWTKGRDMPTPRGWFSTSAIKGKIYAIGGSSAWPPVSLTTVEEFDTGFAVAVEGKLPTLWGRLKVLNGK